MITSRSTSASSKSLDWSSNGTHEPSPRTGTVHRFRKSAEAGHGASIKRHARPPGGFRNASPCADGRKKKALDQLLESPELHPEQAIRTILQQLPSLHESLELPAHLFTLLVENLQLERAAILLPDYDEDVFVPWASCGLDATSIHRLRIPTVDLQMVLDQGDAGVVWIGETSREFAPYFSRREASMLEHLLVFPFVDGDGIQGVLVITETPYFDGYVEHLRIVLAAVGEPAARTMNVQRARRARVMRQSIVFKPAEIGVVTERTAAGAANNVRVVLLQLADVVSQIATSNAHLDAFRVWQDVLRTLAALFASSASVCDADDHRALLLVHGPGDEDLELMIQHVAASIADVLPEVSAIPTLRYQTARYPEDGSDPEALVTSLL